MTPIEERVELRHYYIHRVPELGTRGYINIRADNPLELSVSDRDTADYQTNLLEHQLNQIRDTNHYYEKEVISIDALPLATDENEQECIAFILDKRIELDTEEKKQFKSALISWVENNTDPHQFEVFGDFVSDIYGKSTYFESETPVYYQYPMLFLDAIEHYLTDEIGIDYRLAKKQLWTPYTRLFRTHETTFKEEEE